MPSNTVEPAANSKLLPCWQANTRKGNADYERHPLVNSIVQLPANNVPPHNIESPIKHHNPQTTEPYGENMNTDHKGIENNQTGLSIPKSQGLSSSIRA